MMNMGGAESLVGYGFPPAYAAYHAAYQHPFGYGYPTMNALDMSHLGGESEVSTTGTLFLWEACVHNFLREGDSRNCFCQELFFCYCSSEMRGVDESIFCDSHSRLKGVGPRIRLNFFRVFFETTGPSHQSGRLQKDSPVY